MNSSSASSNSKHHLSDADEDFIRHKIGMLQLSRKADTETTSDMAVQAVLKLQQEQSEAIKKVSEERQLGLEQLGSQVALNSLEIGRLNNEIFK